MHYETRVIAAGHTDEDNDGVCDTCGATVTNNTEDKNDGTVVVIIVAVAVGILAVGAAFYLLKKKKTVTEATYESDDKSDE